MPKWDSLLLFNRSSSRFSRCLILSGRLFRWFWPRSRILKEERLPTELGRWSMQLSWASSEMRELQQLKSAGRLSRRQKFRVRLQRAARWDRISSGKEERRLLLMSNTWKEYDVFFTDLNALNHKTWRHCKCPRAIGREVSWLLPSCSWTSSLRFPIASGSSVKKLLDKSRNLSLRN